MPRPILTAEPNGDGTYSGHCKKCGHRCTTLSPTYYHRCEPKTPTKTVEAGVGSLLHGLLGRFGILSSEDCNCEEHIREMDENGPDWCEANLDTIVGWLRASAAQRGLPFVAFVAKRLVVRAIKLYRLGRAGGCKSCNKKKEKEELAMLEPPDLRRFFERVYVVNLDRRPERYAEFMAGLPDDWPFAQPQRWAASDGSKLSPPSWWRAGGGAWGCYRSHARILETCLADGVKSVLIFEDDATFVEGFSERAADYLGAVPDDWGLLYLGGQHLHRRVAKPAPVNALVDAPYNVNRTHAFAVSGPEFMRRLYAWLHDWEVWRPAHHIDHHLGVLTQTGEEPIYSPKTWLVGQRAGTSSINGRSFKQDRFWLPNEAQLLRKRARKAAKTKKQTEQPAAASEPFVAVLGLHNSGSSCLAGVLYCLGVHMGNRLGGYYGRKPGQSCGYEAASLARMCERWFKYTQTEKRGSLVGRTRRLGRWVAERQREAKAAGTIAGGKYPHLCQLGDELAAAVGPGLRIVAIDRPVPASVAGLLRRAGLDPSDAKGQALAAHQRWLSVGKEAFVATRPAGTVYRVAYDSLLANPQTVITDLAAWLGIKPTDEQMQKAIASVDPAKRTQGTA